MQESTQAKENDEGWAADWRLDSKDTYRVETKNIDDAEWLHTQVN